MKSMYINYYKVFIYMNINVLNTVAELESCLQKSIMNIADVPC